MTAYRLILPAVPPKELTPNGRRRLHHMIEARYVKDTRATFAPLIRSAWRGQPPLTGPLLGRVSVVLPKGRRAIDVDAVPALVKPVLDELEGIAYLNDRQFTDLTYGLRTDATGTYPDGCVVIDLDDGAAA